MNPEWIAKFVTLAYSIHESLNKAFCHTKQPQLIQALFKSWMWLAGETMYSIPKKIK